MAFDNYKRVGHVLYPDQELHANECLISECGRFYVCLQPDGNFVQYRWKPSGRDVCWSSRTHHNCSGYERCVLRWGVAGQVVLQNNLGETYWKMLDDAHLHDHPKELVIQTDSNFVLYKQGGKAVWSSKSHTHDNTWVIPDCKHVSVEQQTILPGIPGTLVIETGFNHVQLDALSTARRLIPPNSSVEIPTPPGVLLISTTIQNHFDPKGKPIKGEADATAFDNENVAPGQKTFIRV